MPTPFAAHHFAQAQIDAAAAMAACVRLSGAGCRLLAAHATYGIPVVVVDRRPQLPDLVPGCLRADASGRDYHAMLDGVRVAWHESRYATTPFGSR